MKNHSIDADRVIPGSLSKLSKENGDFYHLTWKEERKTITRYVRLDEVRMIKAGISAYKKAKNLLDSIAQSNLKSIFKNRVSK